MQLSSKPRGVVEQNLLDRHLDLNQTRVFIDEEEGVATFLLFNLSGKIVGYQQYRPSADKKKKNHPKEGRYYTYVSDEGEQHPKNGRKAIAVFGLESFIFLKNDSPLFMVEGIFDAVVLHRLGCAAIAVLQNNPKKLKSFLMLLPYRKIAIEDGDSASGLSKFADFSVKCPDGEDVSSLAKEGLDGVKNFIYHGIHETKGT